MTRGTPDERGPFDDIVQEILDRPADDPRRRELLRAARRSDGAMDQLRSTAEPLEELRRPFETPDLSGQILDAAHRRRGFIPARVRRWVDRGRFATAAGLLLAMGVLATIQRVWPGSMDLSGQPETLSALPRAVGHDATHSAALFDAGVRRAGEVLEPMVPAAGAIDWGTEAPSSLTAWVLSTNGPEGSVFDTIMTYDPDALGGEVLRVYRVPTDAGGRGSSLLITPMDASVIPEPDPEPLP